MRPTKRLTAVIAGLCLLCCAVPLTALFVGGAGLASFGFLGTLRGPLADLALCGLAGLGAAIAAYAAWQIWARSKDGVACEVPPKKN